MAAFSDVLLSHFRSPVTSEVKGGEEKEPLTVYIQDAMADVSREGAAGGSFNEPFTLISSTAESLGSAAASRTGSKNFMSHVTAGKDWIANKHAKVQPWSEFFNIKHMSRPRGAGDVTGRILSNLQRYQSNYLFVFMGLALYCIITNPTLLFGLAFCLAAWWFISVKNNSENIKLFGRGTSARELYAVVVLICIPLFYFAGAGSTVFWIIGASVVLVLAHAAIMPAHSSHKTVDEELGLVMEEVTIS